MQMSDLVKVSDDVLAQYASFDYDLFNQTNALFDGPASWELPAHIPDLDSLLAMEPTLNTLPFMDMSVSPLASPIDVLAPTPTIGFGVNPAVDFFGPVWSSAFTPDLPGLGVDVLGSIDSLSNTVDTSVDTTIGESDAVVDVPSNPVCDTLSAVSINTTSSKPEEGSADSVVTGKESPNTAAGEEITVRSSSANLFAKDTEAESSERAEEPSEKAVEGVCNATPASKASDIIIASRNTAEPLKRLNTAEMIERGLSKEVKAFACKSKSHESAQSATVAKSSKPNTPAAPDKKRISLANYTRRKISTITPTLQNSKQSVPATTKGRQTPSENSSKPVDKSKALSTQAITTTEAAATKASAPAPAKAKINVDVNPTRAVTDNSTEAEKKRLVPKSTIGPKEQVRTAGNLPKVNSRNMPLSATGKSAVQISKDAKPPRTQTAPVKPQAPRESAVKCTQAKVSVKGAVGAKKSVQQQARPESSMVKHVGGQAKASVHLKVASRVASVFTDTEGTTDTQTTADADADAVGNPSTIIQRKSNAKAIKIGTITGTGTAICKRKVASTKATINKAQANGAKGANAKALENLPRSTRGISQKRTISDVSVCSIGSAATVQSDQDDDCSKRLRTHTSDSVATTSSASVSSVSGTERTYSDSGSETERSSPSQASSPCAKRVNSRAATASPAAVNCNGATPTSPKRVGKDTSVSSDHIAWFNSVVRTRHSSPPPARASRFDRFSNHGNRPSPVAPPHYAHQHPPPPPFRRTSGPREDERFDSVDPRAQAFGPMHAQANANANARALAHERKVAERNGVGIDLPYRDARESERGYIHPSHRWQNETQLQHQDSMYHRQQMQQLQGLRPHPNMPPMGAPLGGPHMGLHPEQRMGVPSDHPRTRNHLTPHIPDGPMKREPEPYYHDRPDDFRRNSDPRRLGMAQHMESAPVFDREREDFGHRSRDRGRSEHRSDRRDASRERSSSRRPQQNNKNSTDHEEEHRLRTVFVGDVSPDLREGEIRRMFGAHGPVESMRLFLERHYFFVTYKTQHGADVAIDEMNGFLLKDGNRLRVSRGGRRAFLKQAWQDSDRYEGEDDGEEGSFDDELRRLLR